MTTDTHPTQTILIIGATGGIGHAVARAFLQAGWQVRALTRHADPSAIDIPGLQGVQWQGGDALREADVERASRGADCIFHGANPPNYRNWRELALPMLANAIAAARVSGARLLFPGNVYNFGPDAWPLISETSPQHPLTRKGAVRVEMEAMLQAAAAQGVRSIVLRAGDFFGGHGPSSWFTTTMIRPHRPLRRVIFPGEPQVGHAWAYLPDLAQTFLQLAQGQEQLGDFEVFHFGGHWLPRNAEVVEAIKRVAGQPRLPVHRLPWPLIRLLSPFVNLLREITEMRYLWQVPVRLDNRKLVTFLGAEPHTELDTAVKHSLQEMGCLA